VLTPLQIYGLQIFRKRRTNLQQPQINKALKNLEGRSLVKAVKTVTV
jgi:hypothetical protein